MRNGEFEQTVYNAAAHVFEIDRSRQRWKPKGEPTFNEGGPIIPIAFIVSRKRDDPSSDHAYGERVLKLIAVENEQIVLESIITPQMTFHRRSDKFGQWEDKKANTFYGLGFSTEAEIEDFGRTFLELQQTYACDDETKSIHSQHAASRTPNTSSTMNSGMSQSQSHHNFSQQSLASNSNGHVGFDDLRKQLEGENKRLMLQLEENAKCKQIENDILATNNHKLTQALEESKVNVAAWEKELASLRKENTDLKMKLAAFETNNNSKKSSEHEEELEEYKMKLERLQAKLQKELQSKDDVIENLQLSLSELKIQQNDESELQSNGVQIREELKASLKELSVKFDDQFAELEKFKSSLAAVVEQV